MASRYSLTYDHDELSLWCNDCATDEKPLETWYGGPTPEDEIQQAADEHEHEFHATTTQEGQQ